MFQMRRALIHCAYWLVRKLETDRERRTRFYHMLEEMTPMGISVGAHIAGDSRLRITGVAALPPRVDERA